MVAASTAFFALPIDVKQRCTPTDPSINRGYAARGTEASVVQHRSRRAARPVRGLQHRRGRASTTTTRSTPPNGAARSLPTSGRRSCRSYAPHWSTTSLGASAGADAHRRVRRRARSSRRLVARLRRPLDHHHARDSLRTSRRRSRPAAGPAANGCAHRLRNRHGALRRSRSPVCRSSLRTANGSTSSQPTGQWSSTSATSPRNGPTINGDRPCIASFLHRQRSAGRSCAAARPSSSTATGTR